MFKGAFTALVTPLRDGQLDLKGLRELTEFQINSGIDGLVPCGTTGEASTLTFEERFQVIKTVVDQTRQRVPVIAGASANATAAAIKNSEAARDAGADGLLHATPYYNKPTPLGLDEHYRAITKAVRLPVLLYNVPSRTGCDLLPPTTAKLANIPNVVGIKEATGSMIRAQDTLVSVPKDFTVLSGDDFTAFSLILLGGHGVISVVSNIAPKLMTQMTSFALDGKASQARAIHYQLLPLIKALFTSSNPILVKAGVALMGYTANELRLPLMPLEEKDAEELRAEMKKVGALK